MKISVVSPVYNEEEVIELFIDEISNQLNTLNLDWELILVVDPCTDGTEKIIKSKIQGATNIRMLRMTRKFGQPSCVIAGIEASNGDAVVVMDCDLQDPPEILPVMVAKWEQGAKIVLAQRDQREGEPLIKRLIAKIGYKFLNRFAEVPIPRNTGDFRLLDRKVIRELLRFKETNSFLRGLVALVGYDPEVVYFKRIERTLGSTKYNRWFGSLKIGFNGVIGFSTALLSVSMIVGILISGVAFFIAICYAIAKLMGANFPIGNTTTVVAILFMGGFNMLSVGILGMYVGRIYDEVKGRPRYIIQESL